jgi:hypothetical protein
MMYRPPLWLAIILGGLAGELLARFVLWLLAKYVIKQKPEPETLVKLEPVCECGHTRDEHSPCSPMGCTKCDCWKTPTWIGRND